MCRHYEAYWADLDGNKIEGAPGFDFPTPEEEEVLPTCTCWIADGSRAGENVFDAFLEQLRPLLRQPFVGKIVIEVR